MSAILKFDLKNNNNNNNNNYVFSEVNYKLHKKDPILHVTTTFS